MTYERRSPSPDERELRLWKVGRALTLMFVTAILVAGGVFSGLVVLLDFQEIDTTAKLDSTTLFDLVKLSFGVVAGAGALVALVVAYRRQRVDESGAHREATRLHTERFSQAVGMLGSESPAVRLGGVHALAGLADDAPDNDMRQTCIDVLCAYLRLPFSPDPGDLPAPLPNGTSSSEEWRDAHQEKRNQYRAMREVRHTILRLIGEHYRIPRGSHRSWQGFNLDLTGTTIDGQVSFADATFSGGTVLFTGAVFSGGDVRFDGATFSGGTVQFDGATFSDGSVRFNRAVFSGADVRFDGATFTGSTVRFDHATFSGGCVHFDDATFSRGYVGFVRAQFSGSNVHFDGASLSGGAMHFDAASFSRGYVVLAAAALSGGTLSFDEATFSGGSLDLVRAAFSGATVRFDGAAISDSSIIFEGTTFSDGHVSFTGTTFSGGTVRFDGAAFSEGTASFVGATFSGGTVLFDATTGPAPSNLIAAVGHPVPRAVSLPILWLYTPLRDE